MGRMGKYYEENCLLQQAFVKENKVSVEKHVAEVAKAAGRQDHRQGLHPLRDRRGHREEAGELRRGDRQAAGQVSFELVPPQNKHIVPK